MTDTLRESDVVGRLGGDEFAVALPRTNIDEAADVLARVHVNLRQLLQTLNLSVTASIGAVTVAPGAESSIEKVCDQADLTMYSIKNSTKDAVTVKPYLPR